MNQVRRRFTYSKPEEFLPLADSRIVHEVIRRNIPRFIEDMNRHHPLFIHHHKVWGICVRYQNLPCIFISGDSRYDHIDCFKIGDQWYKNINKKLVRVSAPNLEDESVRIVYSGMKSVRHAVNQEYKRFTGEYKVFVQLESGMIYLGNFRTKYVKPVYDIQRGNQEIACTFELVTVE